jgi:hypothetical protein
MLPSPATTRWSSSAAFRLVFLLWQARASMSASNSLPSGSGPSPCSSGLIIEFMRAMIFM